ncbi:MAG: ArsC/Spx/MgsR family protein [Flavobacteriaceae bacterium]
MTLKIYHNPRCRKSREALQYLEDQQCDFEPVLYIENGLSEEEIASLLVQLEYRPEELIRKNEAIWKENYKGKSLSAEALITALSKHPKLIERPIISNGKKAVIARPIDKLKDFLN